MSLCPCGSEQEFDVCCNRYISGGQQPATAEAMMRARYSAYASCAFDFLHQSLHPSHRDDHDQAATRRWAESSEWLGLEIVSTEAGGESDEEGVVEFIATFREKGMMQRYHERSDFKRDKGNWYFVEGKMVMPKTEVHQGPKVGRNDPCPCGSGRKYKKCCGR